MSRTPIVGAVVVLIYVAAIIAPVGINRDIPLGSTAAAKAFRLYYLDPILGELSRCIDLVTEDAEDPNVFQLRYQPRRGCDDGRTKNRALNVLAKVGRRTPMVVRVAPKGVRKFGGHSVVVGAAPSYSPGFTVCKGDSSETMLVDPTGELGELPGEFTSDGKPAILVPGRVFAHEIGHAHACAQPSLVSKSEAVSMENWYVLGQDPAASLRIYHDAPWFIRGR